MSDYNEIDYKYIRLQQKSDYNEFLIIRNSYYKEAPNLTLGSGAMK